MRHWLALVRSSRIIVSMLYLSSPYSSPDPSLRAERAAVASEMMATLIAAGHVTVCPVAMNHEAMELLNAAGSPVGAYWRELESRLAGVCDELVVLRTLGWRESRGVAREIALFENLGKPVRFIDREGSPQSSFRHASSAADPPNRHEDLA